MILGNYIQLGLKMKCTTKVLKKRKKRPHHLTFLLETPVFIGVSEREVFGEQVTQHLT